MFVNEYSNRTVSVMMLISGPETMKQNSSDPGQTAPIIRAVWSRSSFRAQDWREYLMIIRDNFC